MKIFVDDVHIEHGVVFLSWCNEGEQEHDPAWTESKICSGDLVRYVRSHNLNLVTVDACSYGEPIQYKQVFDPYTFMLENIKYVITEYVKDNEFYL